MMVPPMSELSPNRRNLIAGIAGLGGVVTMLAMQGRAGAAAASGGFAVTYTPAQWRARSPLETPPTPAPTLLLHGTDDGLVPIAQARRLAARRDALGLPTRLVELPDAPHAFFNAPCEAADRSLRELVAHLTEP